MTRFRLLVVCAVLASALAFTGCGSGQGPKPEAHATTPSPTTPPADEVAVERAKLPAAERALVEAQEWCVVSTDERLGSMGAPIKLDIKGQAVFVCCKGCERKAKADPDATLAKVAELKEKAKAKK